MFSECGGGVRAWFTGYLSESGKGAITSALSGHAATSALRVESDSGQVAAWYKRRFNTAAKLVMLPVGK